MIRKFMIFLFCTFSLHASSQQVIDQIVAQVGGEVVLLSHIQERLRHLRDQFAELPEEATCGVLEQLLVEKLLVNQAKLDSIVVTDEEVDLQLTARFAQILSFLNNDPEEFQRYYGKTMDEMREEMREPQKDRVYAERMEDAIVSRIKVTPTEVIEFFNNIPKDSLPYFNSEVEIKEIVYKPKPNADERQKALESLQEIRRRIVEVGEDFADLAFRHSNDPGSASRGGNLGWAKRGTFVPEFEAEVFKLDINEISKIVETEFGFHLIQLLDRKGDRIQLRHILIKPEITDDDYENARHLLDSLRKGVMFDSLDFELLVQEYSDQNEQSYNNGGRVTNMKTGNTFFEVGDLDPDTYFAIDTLQPGKLTGPIEYSDRTGEVYYKILLLQSRSAPHQANLKQDYAKIQDAARENKKNQILNQWLEEKVNETFIIVEPKFLACPGMDKYTKRIIKP